MRLISLQINNFRVIKDVRMSFPDSVIGIIGPNGAGKSSIIEAVSWALYGNQAARTGKDEIKSSFASSEDNCEVALEFSVNEERYKVIRRLVGRTERAEVELYRGDNAESVGVNETKAYVGQLLGLDWRGFLSSFLARQAELNALSDLQPSKRRDHIAGMLGIERLDKAIQRVKEDSRLHKEKGHFLENQIARKEQVTGRAAELRSAISDLVAPLEKLKSDVEEKQARLKVAKDTFETSQKKRDEWLRLENRLEAESKAARDISEQLEDLNAEKKNLLEDEQKLADLGKQLAELTPAREEYERLKDARSRVTMREDLLKRQKTLSEKQEQSRKASVSLEEKLAALEAILKGIPENIEQRFADEQKKLDQARDEFSRLRAELDTYRNQTTKLNDQLASIGKLGPESVCDRCHRPFGDDYEQIKGHLSEELAQLKATAVETEKRLTERKQAGEKLRDSVAALEVSKNTRYQLNSDIQSRLREKQSLQNQLEDQRKSLDELGGQLKELEAVKFDPVQFAAAENKVKQLDELRQQHDRLTGQLARLPQVEKSIESLNAKASETKEKVKTLESELKALAFDEKKYRDSVEAFEKSREEVESATKAYLSGSKEKELAEKELEGKLEQLKSFEKAEKELEDSRSAHYYGEKLGRLFADFKQELIATIRPSLAELSSRLMAEMTGGRYNLIELDEKYNLRVMDSGVYYGVDRFSGGEKDLANLCLRLAISLALTESAGLTRSFVILDEVFGSQDDQRKELILKAMGQLKQRFPQILLVTHVDDVKDGVEQIVEVAPTGNGWSEVKLNGSII